VKKFSYLLAICLVFSTLAFAGEPVDLEMVGKIRNEGISNSKIMETIEYLCDVIGPRITASPAFKQANEWARDRMAEWGLENAHLESWDFGLGWSFSHSSVHMVSPRQTPLLALPKAWTPGTDGTVTGEVMKVKIESKEDLEKYKGKVAGKILFLSDPKEVKERDSEFFRRLTKEELEEMIEYPIRGSRNRFNDPEFRKRMMARMGLRDSLNQFLVDEKVLATVEISSRDNALLRVGGGGSREVDGNPGVTALVMAVEHYNWICRLIDRQKKEVKLELNIVAQFHGDDTKGYNTIADIPGTEAPEEIVLIGGHIDSWHTGTGATDNAAGVAVAMEAARILKALEVQPRRTIRVGLWGGEEQGFLGSTAYINAHLAERKPPEGEDESEKNVPSFMRRNRGPLELKPGHETFSVYFNYDNGGGRIRGIYAEGNSRVKPIFESWLEPLADLGATTVTLRNTGGTDHVPFDRVGLPGFQFIQDPLDYSSRTHHSNVDVVDHLRREDLIQASIVMATFAYHAAMHDDLMPRKPLPSEEAPQRGGK